jgi:UDP-GlcNAc:undecaprenyl-phosphate GlcNAc-1-phosphate transferase
MRYPTELHALYAFLVATLVTALTTPLSMRLALRIGAVDRPRDRGLSDQVTPRLGGLAIFAGTFVAGWLWLPDAMWHVTRNVTATDYRELLLACAVITFVGALDDRFDIHPALKLAGQIGAAAIAVDAGVWVRFITLPFIGHVSFPHAGTWLTVIGLVALMNIVNFSDGVDGLAAGVCAIVAGALTVIAFDLGNAAAGVLGAITAGAALGFLVHNFPRADRPARVFMGDSGSNLLGLLMGCVAVEASVKTEVVVSFVVPLILLAVPFLDTTFVVLKRLKYRQPVYRADSEHFHHRLARIGFSNRQTLAYMYTWTLMLAGLALALRFVPYSDHHGHYALGWSLVMLGIALLVAVASVYLVYGLEILKFRRLDAIRLRRLRPDASSSEIERGVESDLETGEYDVVVGPQTPEQRSLAAAERLSAHGSVARPEIGR